MLPGRLGLRFALEALFLVLLAIGAGLADLRPALIVLVMAVAWVLVAIVEFTADRISSSPLSYLLPEPGAAAPEEEAERVAWPMPEERTVVAPPEAVAATERAATPVAAEAVPEGEPLPERKPEPEPEQRQEQEAEPRLEQLPAEALLEEVEPEPESELEPEPIASGGSDRAGDMDDAEVADDAGERVEEAALDETLSRPLGVRLRSLLRRREPEEAPASPEPPRHVKLLPRRTDPDTNPASREVAELFEPSPHEREPEEERR
jgi:hypothetical protein